METSTQTMPGKPDSTLENGDSAVTGIGNLYNLYFHRGGYHQVYSKTFFSKLPTFKQVVERGKRHCETLSLRFIRVEPFLSDLTADEKKHSDEA